MTDIAENAFQERIIFYLTAKQFDCADLEYFKEETDADNEQGLAVTLSRPVSVAYFLFFLFILFLCLPQEIAPLCPNQRLSLCSPHQ